MTIPKQVILWLLRIVAAIIMIQSLFFKFSAAEESVFIFSTLNMEPWGRIGIGTLELIAAILILYPRTTWIGAALGVAVMSGAIFFHLTSLGIEVHQDHGQLFIYAIITWICCAVLLLIEREKIQLLIHSLKSK
jgi:uncharacterized membrane protein YphA (DoxX/SURF4 family)